MTIPTVPPRMKLQPGDVVRHRTREQLLGDSYHSLDKFIEQGDLLVESVCDEGPRTRVAVKRVDVHGNPMEGLSGNDVWDSDRFYLLRPAGGFKPGDKIIHRPLREVPFLPFVGSQIDKIHVVDRVDTEQYVGIQRIFLKDMAGFLKDIAGSGSWAQQRFRLVERPEASSDGSAQPLNSEPADGIQVGSWVRVTKPTDPEESSRHWHPDMDRFNGRVFKVRLIRHMDGETKAYLHGAVINETDTVGYYFLHSWLTPVNKPKITEVFLPGDLVEVTTEGEAKGYPSAHGKKNYVKAVEGGGISCGNVGDDDPRTGDGQTGWWGDPDSLKLLCAGDGSYKLPEATPPKPSEPKLTGRVQTLEERASNLDTRINSLEAKVGKGKIEEIVEERIKGLRSEVLEIQRLTGQLSGYRTDHQTQLDALQNDVNELLKWSKESSGPSMADVNRLVQENQANRLAIEKVDELVGKLNAQMHARTNEEQKHGVAINALQNGYAMVIDHLRKTVSLSHVDQVEERLRKRDEELDSEIKHSGKRLDMHWELLTERVDRTNASLDRAHKKLTELELEGVDKDGRVFYVAMILCAVFSLALGLTISHFNGKLKAVEEKRESF